MSDFTPGLLQGIAQYPIAASQLRTASQAGASAIADYDAIGDRIQPGTSGTSQYLQDLAAYISDEETLLATLESLAASGSGAAAWASPEIDYLKQSIASNIGFEYAGGGTVSGLTQSAALIGIPGVAAPAPPVPSAAPAAGTSVTPAPTTPQGIASAAAASAIALQSGFASIASAGNSQSGTDITQSGGANYAFGVDIGQEGIGNYGAGSHIREVGFGNTGAGNWLDALGSMNSQYGSNLLAIGSFNFETGSFDVANGSSNTISGSFDMAYGNNDTIIGDSARVFGSGLTASTGQIVFGSAASFTVVNADGTWSTVVNSVVSSASTGATQNSSLMSAENSATASGFLGEVGNIKQLSSQFAALGWVQMPSAILDDMSTGSFNNGPF